MSMVSTGAPIAMGTSSRISCTPHASPPRAIRASARWSSSRSGWRLPTSTATTHGSARGPSAWRVYSARVASSAASTLLCTRRMRSASSSSRRGSPVGSCTCRMPVRVSGCRFGSGPVRCSTSQRCNATRPGRKWLTTRISRFSTRPSAGGAGLGVDADLQVRLVEQRHRDLERRARGAQAPGPDAPQRRDVADAVVIAVLAEPVVGLPRGAGGRAGDELGRARERLGGTARGRRPVGLDGPHHAAELGVGQQAAQRGVAARAVDALLPQPQLHERFEVEAPCAFGRGGGRAVGGRHGRAQRLVSGADAPSPAEDGRHGPTTSPRCRRSVAPRPR